GFPCRPSESVVTHPVTSAGQPGSPAPARPTLGPYELVARLGAGGQAEVHLARDETLRRHVALKVYRDLTDRHALRLHREMSAACLPEPPPRVRLRAPGLPRPEADKAVYLDLEFVPGPSLGIYTAEGRLLPPREAARIVSRLARALAVLHRCGGVHRD